MKVSRPKPLVVEAYAGDISKVDLRMIQQDPPIWAVVAIELIEHLYSETLRGFEISVFGVLSPSLVIVTTPNSDFNHVFNLEPGKFRHWDHKFEWSRKEFFIWCEKICTEFPDYRYTIQGICPHPSEDSVTELNGCVSQMAVFKKTDKAELELNEPANPALYPGVVQEDAYKLIDCVHYPNFVETRSLDKIILDELTYTISTYWLNQRMVEQYNEIGTTEIFFPIRNLERACGETLPLSLPQNLEYMK
jgi:hypothetical protein